MTDGHDGDHITFPINADGNETVTRRLQWNNEQQDHTKRDN